MYYIHLYTERLGLNPTMNDEEFSGPVLGPITKVKWERGHFIMMYCDQLLYFSMSECCDHIIYGGSYYDSFEVINHVQLTERVLNFCRKPVPVHSIDMIKSLINK